MADLSSAGSRESDPTISEGERREALQVVLGNVLFRRSNRLRHLLSFLVEQTLESNDASLTEQKIGVTLLGRQPYYDTGSDNIVRVYASELRKRLDTYYAGDGIKDPVRIGIPRGSYRPLFQRRTAEGAHMEGLPDLSRVSEEFTAMDPAGLNLPATPPCERRGLSQGEAIATSINTSPPAVPERKGSVPNPTISRTSVFGMLLFAVTAVLLVVQTVRIHSMGLLLQPWRAGLATRELWGTFLQGREPTTVVLADTSFAMAQDLEGYRLTLNDYLNQSYLQRLSDLAVSPGDGDVRHTVLSLISNRNMGSMSDFRTARRIMGLDPTSSRVEVRFARDFSGELLRHQSTVLIGSARSDPWVGIFQNQLFYQMESPSSGSSIVVRLNHPGPGEGAMYMTSSDPNRTDGFCVIALLTNPSGEGKTLIIAGTDSQATEAGGDFMTQESSLEELRTRLGGALSEPFQLLLRTSRAAGSPLDTSVMSARRGSL